MNSFDKIYKLTSSIPKGKITTYGAISKIVGVNPRVVGYALHANKNPDTIPCHRVIKTNGKIANGYAFGGPDIQKKILIKEGIVFDKTGKVNLKKFAVFIS